MIEVSNQDTIAVVKLVHGRASALDIEFCQTMTTQFEQLSRAPARAVVMTGHGNIFCAGVDLRRVLEGGAPYIRQLLPALNALFHTLFFFPKPLVAALNGHAIAGGCVLACTADRRILRQDGARVGVTELQVGVPFPALASEIMRYATAHHRFAEIMLNADTYDALEALDCGLVDEIVPAHVVVQRALAVAEKLAYHSPEAFALTKARIRSSVLQRVQVAGTVADQQATEVWTSPSTLQRIRDYAERTLKKVS